MLAIIITFICLIVLISIHELGHFLTAKKFKVRVEEFGIGYPPRFLAKKIGETIYSINLLPFGAFVRIPEKDRQDSGDFLSKPLWQRVLIIFNGAFAFWITAAVVFSIVFAIGAPTIISDAEANVPDTKILITSVDANSPAQGAGLMAGDIIVSLKGESAALAADKVSEVHNFVVGNKGNQISIIFKRNNEIKSTSLVPRINPPAGQGPMGIGLVRIGLKSSPLYLAVFEGAKTTLAMTKAIIKAYGNALTNLFKKMPSGLQLSGPVGIVGFLSKSMKMGANYFLQMIGLLSINVAIINLLPIPAFDGGKLMFLGIEAIRKKPIPQKVEEKVTAVFFVLLIILMVFVTIKDVRNFKSFL